MTNVVADASMNLKIEKKNNFFVVWIEQEKWALLHEQILSVFIEKKFNWK